MSFIFEMDQEIARLNQMLTDAIPDPMITMACSMTRRLMEPVRTSYEPINIEDATRPPKVGEVYNVWTIRTGGNMDLILPLLGPEHDDSDTPEMGPGAAQKHWHIDYRFLPKSLYNVLLTAHGSASGAAEEDLPAIMMHTLTLPTPTLGEPERRALRCERTHARFKPPYQVWLGALEAKNQDKKVECDRCPHRGFSLVGAYTDEVGIRYCPGHGLAWDKNGELVRQS